MATERDDDDAELWLPSDIYPDEKSYRPPKPDLDCLFVEDLTRHIAALALLDQRRRHHHQQQHQLLQRRPQPQQTLIAHAKPRIDLFGPVGGRFEGEAVQARRTGGGFSREPVQPAFGAGSRPVEGFGGGRGGGVGGGGVHVLPGQMNRVYPVRSTGSVGTGVFLPSPRVGHSEAKKKMPTNKNAWELKQQQLQKQQQQQHMRSGVVFGKQGMSLPLQR
ncbi:hypothetical protein QJS10_CPB13g01478 [Acorus calamus]|uniref:Uncharacterized protein n=1 Tax=Acorus calamus TaxID=4465 RepID=A0AAV9DKI2_ACOCL|nr:hypothetical protein QJS10_CPB13g01478 [Acorus calamus]